MLYHFQFLFQHLCKQNQILKLSDYLKHFYKFHGIMKNNVITIISTNSIDHSIGVDNLNSLCKYVNKSRNKHGTKNIIETNKLNTCDVTDPLTYL